MAVRPTSMLKVIQPLGRTVAVFKSSSPPGAPANSSNYDTPVSVTRLSNGLTVATQQKFGTQCTIGGNVWQFSVDDTIY